MSELSLRDIYHEQWINPTITIQTGQNGFNLMEEAIAATIHDNNFITGTKGELDATDAMLHAIYSSPNYTSTTIPYRKIKAVNNSLMTMYEKDFRSFKNYWLYDQERESEVDESLMLGSIIDALLTKPNDFASLYYIFIAESPTGQMLTYCQELFKLRQKDLITSQEELELKAYEIAGFKRDTVEKVRERFKIEGLAYYTACVSAIGKTVITQEQYNKAAEIVRSLQISDFTKSVINQKTIKNDTHNIEVINQLEIILNIQNPNELSLKGALDKVIIDHNKKIIIPFDIKSSASLNTFEISYYKYNYFRQGSYYTYLLKQWAVDKGYENYKIINFMFIVCSTTGQGNYIYKMSDRDLQLAELGGVTKHNQEIKGWRDLLEDIKWHIKEKKWDYPKKVYENNGIITLNMFA